MQGLGGVFGELFVQRGATRTISTGRLLSKSSEPIEIDKVSQLPPEIDSEKDPDAQVLEAPGSKASTERNRILKIFTTKGDTFELSDNRLKATSQAEYLRRLTYLFLYAHECFDRPSTKESDVKAILRSAKVWDASGNANKWLNKRIGIGNDGEDRIKLTTTGREEAVKTLGQTLDSNMVDAWNPDKNASKTRGTRGKKKS